MNADLRPHLFALSIGALTMGAVSNPMAAETGGLPGPSAPAAEQTEQATQVQRPAPTGNRPPAEARAAGAAEAEPAQAERTQAAPEAAEPLASDPGQAPATNPPAADPTDHDEDLEPVTGAFGIPLDQPFEPCMVAKVISQEPIRYLGLDKTKKPGTRYRVEPTAPDERFSVYYVDVSGEGRVYAIWGEFEADDRASKCDLTKELAASLEARYGKPRGRGGFGEWYAFRDMSSDLYRGVRLYANRCRRGIYSIVYGDDNAKMAPAPPQPEPGENGSDR